MINRFTHFIFSISNTNNKQYVRTFYGSYIPYIGLTHISIAADKKVNMIPEIFSSLIFQTETRAIEPTTDQSSPLCHCHRPWQPKDDDLASEF